MGQLRRLVGANFPTAEEGKIPGRTVKLGCPRIAFFRHMTVVPGPFEWRMVGSMDRCDGRPVRCLREVDGLPRHDSVRHAEPVSGQDPDGTELAAWRRPAVPPVHRLGLAAAAPVGGAHLRPPRQQVRHSDPADGHAVQYQLDRGRRVKNRGRRVRTGNRPRVHLGPGDRAN